MTQKRKSSVSNGQLSIETILSNESTPEIEFNGKKTLIDWQELVESVKIDFNYNGDVLNPSIVDSPENELVKGTYAIPDDAGTIRVKITDLLSESLEETVE